MVKTTSPSPYCFLSGQSNSTSALSPSNNYVLLIRQQPETAKVCGIKERDRRPIDPPPIVQIKLANASSDRHKDYLQSPYLFMCCNLVHASDPHGDIVAPAHRALAGTVVSSLNRLKDIDNSDGGFFVFGDISVRVEGHFILRFSLFELLTKGQVVHIVSTLSNPLTVYSSKTFPGMSESTFLSRSFSDQGVRIRIRKDHHHHIKSRRALASVGSFSDSSNRVSAMHNPPSLSSHEVDRSDYDTKGNNVSRKSRPKTKKKNNTACSVSRIRASSAQQPYYKPVAIAARPSSANAQPRHHGSHESTEHTTSPSTPRYFNINSQNPYPFPSDNHRAQGLSNSRTPSISSTSSTSSYSYSSHHSGEQNGSLLVSSPCIQSSPESQRSGQTTPPPLDDSMSSLFPSFPFPSLPPLCSHPPSCTRLPPLMSSISSLKSMSMSMSLPMTLPPDLRDHEVRIQLPPLHLLPNASTTPWEPCRNWV